MKYIYILENEEKFRDELVETIRKIDPQLSIRLFSSLDEFSKWIKLVMQEGFEALPKGGTAPAGQAEPGSGPHQLLLIISKNEFLGAGHMNLLCKTRDLFIKKGLCTAEDPTSLVLTSFESPDFDISLAEDRIINNVLFKPFDKLILRQHLTFAINGRHPVSSYSVHNMKTSAMIEMLKKVEIEALSDVGFVSISNRPIQVGALAKYYSPSFVSLQHRSMMALCVRCEPHPERADHFRCGFAYLAADSFQITNIRKQVRQKDLKPFAYDWIEKAPSAEVEVALISNDESVVQNFKNTLESRFSNIQIHHFASLQDLLYTVDPELAKKDKKEFNRSKMPRIKNTLNAIFAEHPHFEGNFQERWQSILDTLNKNLKPAATPDKKPAIFNLGKNAYTDQEKRALGEVLKDVFIQPTDPIYLCKKIMLYLPGLKTKEELNLPTVHLPHTAKAASPIEISEFSEAGLVFKYYRPVSTGAFREFVLWLPHELDTPEFLASCNYSEESRSEKGVFLNQFVFFGTNDHFLKHIRRWILQNHVQSKEES